MWRRTGPEANEFDQGGLGEECDAFLAGAWVECLEAHGEPIPSWGWLNRVAHAGQDQLRSIAAMPGRSGRHSEAWRQASSFLAAELLDLAERTSREVADLQREVLVPFELALFDDSQSRRLNPGQLVARILTALPDHPSRRS